MKNFLAAVSDAPHLVHCIREICGADLGHNDVLVRIEASGLCHSDLEVVDGGLAMPFSIVLGHEGAGVVVEVGSQVDHVQLGDHVVCSWNPSCGACFYCQRNEPILCERCSSANRLGTLPDGELGLSTADGPVHHFNCVSSHAQYAVVPAAGAIVVDRRVPLDRACLIGCGVMTGVGSMTRVASEVAGSSVAVFGCGAVGLNVIQGARLAGARQIVAIDPDKERRSLAIRLGASHGVNPMEHDAVATVRRSTDERGADICVESAGEEEAMVSALKATRPGGQLILLGKLPVEQTLSIPFGYLMGDRRIRRSSYGGARPSRDFPWLAGLYLSKRLHLDEPISQRVSLGSIDSGFASMRAGTTVRTVVLPHS